MTPQQIAAAAQLRLDVLALQRLAERAERGEALSAPERLALADWQRARQGVRP